MTKNHRNLPSILRVRWSLYFQNGGFFIECGGFDGETGSNSLYFEKTRGWSGLLIEADPVFYTKLKSKNRKAFTANVCLSTVPYPAKVSFKGVHVRGMINKFSAPCTSGYQGMKL